MIWIPLGIFWKQLSSHSLLIVVLCSNASVSLYLYMTNQNEDIWEGEEQIFHLWLWLNQNIEYLVYLSK